MWPPTGDANPKPLDPETPNLMAFKGSCIDYVLYGIYRGTIRGLGCLIEVLYNLLDDVIAVHVLDAFYDIVHEAASGRSPQAEICFLPPESRST